MLEALHAAPFSKSDARWLSCLGPRKPNAIPALKASPDFYTILQAMPKAATRLTGCAVWAKGCFAELDARKAQSMDERRPSSGPHCYCTKMADCGMFEAMYHLLIDILEVVPLFQVVYPHLHLQHHPSVIAVPCCLSVCLHVHAAMLSVCVSMLPCCLSVFPCRHAVCLCVCVSMQPCCLSVFKFMFGDDRPNVQLSVQGTSS